MHPFMAENYFSILLALIKKKKKKKFSPIAFFNCSLVHIKLSSHKATKFPIYDNLCYCILPATSLFKHDSVVYLYACWTCGGL